jgi:hypothetical protein
MAMNSLYSCFTITAAASDQIEWDVFLQGKGHPVAGDLGLIASYAHTNIPRSGETGIPMGWEAFIRQWRATMNVRFVDGPLLEWAQSTLCKLHFNGRTFSTAPLLDLLAAPQAVFEDCDREAFFSDRMQFPASTGADLPGFRPMWIRENLSYGVTVTSPAKDVEAVRRWLVDNTINGRLLCWLHLDGVVLPANRN